MSYPPPGGPGDPYQPQQPSSGPPDQPSSGQPSSGPPSYDPTQPPAYPSSQPPPPPPAYGQPGATPGPDPYAASYGQYGQPPYGQPGYPQPYAQPSRGTNVMAVLSLVLSLLGIFTCITAPAGAILGHVAKRQIAQSGEEGRGLASAGQIIGWIVTGLWIIGCGIWVIVVVVAGNGSFDTT
jgi:hypothetical protein